LGVNLQSLQCLKCKHYIGAGYCEAFPDGIPSEVMSGKFEHTKPYPGDNGIQFELDDDFKDLTDD